VTIKNIHDKENLKNDMIWQIISFITNAFVLAWTISGAIIFWRLMDNSKCTDSLYNYMYALLIIKLALLFMDIMGRRNKDRPKVNAIY
jgi:hypothetical protein